MESKICTKCNEEKYFNRVQFRKDRGYFTTVCKDCQNIYKRNWLEKNPMNKEKQHNYTNQWEKLNRDKRNKYRCDKR